MTASFKVEEIRNKLTPITTLIDLIESGEQVNLSKFILKAKESVNHLSSSEVYTEEEFTESDILIDSKGKITPYGKDDYEKKIIELIIKWRKNVKSPINKNKPIGYRSIANHLNDNGYRRRNGKLWVANSVYYILKRHGVLKGEK